MERDEYIALHREWEEAQNEATRLQRKADEIHERVLKAALEPDTPTFVSDGGSCSDGRHREQRSEVQKSSEENNT
jgi:hypothetical protein